MSLKFIEELCVMKIKNDAIFLRRIDLPFKNIEMRNLTKFDLSTQKSQKFTL